MAKRKRGNGEGSVTKVRGKSLWRVCTSFKDTHGRRHRPTRYAKTKAEGMRILQDMLYEIKSGNMVIPSKMTVRDLMTDWLNNVASERVAPATLSRYQSLNRNHIEPRIGSVKCQSLNPSKVQFVMDDMRKAGQSGSSRKQVYTILNQSFRRALQLQVINRNPCDAVQCPRIEHSEHDILTAEEIVKFLKAAEQDRLYALYVVAITTGLRLSELTGLKWSDINFDNGTVSIRRKAVQVGGKNVVDRTKTKKSTRSIELPQVAISALRKHLKIMMKKGLAGEWVFCTTTGTMLHRQNLQRRSINPICIKAGIKRITIKTLRHSCASALLSKNVHPKIVQEILGHSRIGTTMDIYSHLFPTLQKDAMGHFDELLG